MVESEEAPKSFLRKVKEDSEKPGLKVSIQKTKIMASDPPIHGKDWKKVELLTDLIFLGSQITADGDLFQFSSVQSLSCVRLFVTP